MVYAIVISFLAGAVLSYVYARRAVQAAKRELDLLKSHARLEVAILEAVAKRDVESVKNAAQQVASRLRKYFCQVPPK